jgi:hypothetical protein
MGWWSSIINGTKSTAEQVGNGLKMAWGWGQPVLGVTVNYVSNTAVQIYHQSIALKHTIPGFMTPENYKVVKAVAQVVTYKILPLILLNMMNQHLQTMTHGQDDEEDAPWKRDAMVLSAATFIDWMAWGYTQRQGITLCAEIMAIDIFGPIAATAHLNAIPKSPGDPCVINKCNFQRRLKGTGREILSLWLIDSTSDVITYLAGKPIGFIFSLLSHGNEIAHAVNYRNCPRHRTTDSETILVLGSTYTMVNMLIEYALERKVGLPPAVVQKAISHLIVLAVINNAAHMPIKYVEVGKGTLVYDPFFLYERAIENTADRVFLKTKTLLTKYFQPNPGRPPIINLNWLLKSLKQALDSDLEKVREAHPGFFKSSAKKILPPVVRSARDLVSNPVIRIFWTDIHDLLVDIAKIIDKVSNGVNGLTQSRIPLVPTATTSAAPTIVNWKLGLPNRLTSFLISLCEKEDFLALTRSFEEFLKRHSLKVENRLSLVDEELLKALHEGNSTETPPGKRKEQGTGKPITVIDTGKMRSPEGTGTEIINPNRFMAPKLRKKSITGRPGLSGEPQLNAPFNGNQG